MKQTAAATAAAAAATGTAVVIIVVTTIRSFNGVPSYYYEAVTKRFSPTDYKKKRPLNTKASPQQMISGFQARAQVAGLGSNSRQNDPYGYQGGFAIHHATNAFSNVKNSSIILVQCHDYR
ncbi:hypothetical protein PoB_004236100 [Plakobranchus ocellatus]|uniref:Secreted protein n=1 Tax=Plakobranchus ocellatus TaxID=259542 RepID=A0AAV4BAL5_9GAST|nr:hypothetical protein PoB_004236100 [Plakobranchus ocellatus]